MQADHFVRERFPGQFYYRVPELDCRGLVSIDVLGPSPPGVRASLSRNDAGYTASIAVGQAEPQPADAKAVFVHEFAQALCAGLRLNQELVQPVRSPKSRPLEWPYECKSTASGANLEFRACDYSIEYPERLTEWLRALPPLFGAELRVRVSYRGNDRHPQVLKVALARRDLDTAGLTPREEYVLSRRYGWEDGVEHTQAEIGNELNLTRARIFQIEMAACYKLGSYHRKIIAINLEVHDPGTTRTP